MTDGYTFVDLLLANDDLVVLFRWHKDPTVYGVRVSEHEVDRAEYAVDALALELSEELNTGLTLRVALHAFAMGRMHKGIHAAQRGDRSGYFATAALAARFR